MVGVDETVPPGRLDLLSSHESADRGQDFLNHGVVRGDAADLNPERAGDDEKHHHRADVVRQ